MKSFRLDLHAYRRPLLLPLTIGSVCLSDRLGFFIEAEDREGRRAFAECAPLAGLHRETLKDAMDYWEQAVGPALGNVDWNLWSVGADFFGLNFPRTSPAVQSSVEMLLLHLAIERGLFELPAAPCSDSFEHSALVHLPRVPDAAWWQALYELRKRGIQCIKVKIGREKAAFEQDLLGEVRSLLGPEARFRLDANRGLNETGLLSWKRFLERGDWSIDYFEEAALESRQVLGSQWPLAMDESLSGLDPLHTQPLPELAVLKPNRLGLSRSIVWMKTLNARMGRVVLSNAYESELSLQLYAWLYGRIVHKPEALGLGTIHAFSGVKAEGPLAPYAAHAAWPKSPRLGPEAVPGLEILDSRPIWPRST